MASTSAPQFSHSPSPSPQASSSSSPQLQDLESLPSPSASYDSPIIPSSSPPKRRGKKTPQPPKCIPESRLSVAEMDKMRRKCCCPLGLQFIAFSKDSTPPEKLYDHKTVAIWKAQIDAGLRLPPPPFLAEVCNYYRIPFYQLTPSAIRRLYAFHILCRFHGVGDTAQLFFQTQSLRMQNSPLYSFASLKKYPTTFLSSLNSHDKNFLFQYCYVRTLSGSWREYFVSELQWHNPRTTYKPASPDAPSTFDLGVIAHLNAMNKAQPLDCKYLAENNSALAYNGLFPLYPQKSIDMSWRNKCGAKLPDITAPAPSGEHGSGGSVSRTSLSEQPTGAELIAIPSVVEISEGNVEPSRPFDAEETDAGALVHRSKRPSTGDASGTCEEDIQIVDITDEIPSPDSAPGVTLAELSKKRKRGSLISVGEKEKQEGLKKAGKSQEPAKKSAGGSKVLPSAGEKGKGPAKKSAGGSKVPASAGGKGKGKAVVPPADEPEDVVPGPISSLSGQGLIDALIARVHSKDQEKVEKLTRGVLATQLCQLALQVEARMWGAVKCIHDYDMAEKEREKEQADIAKRDDDVAGVVERLSKAEAEIAELKAQLAQAEVEKSSLVSELTRTTKESHESLVRFKAGYEKAYRETRRGWKKTLVEAQNRAYILGVRDQRLEYFLSPQGQHFLGVMLEGTLGAFKKTPEYLEDFGPLFAYVIERTATKALEMAGATPEQLASLDFRALMDNLKDEEINELMGIPANSPGKPEWWYPVLEKAIPYFTLGIGFDSLPSAPMYMPAFSASLVRFVNRLRDPTGKGTRTFSQFSMEPPLPSDLAPSAFSDSASSSAAVDQLFDLYRDENLYVQEAMKLLDLGARLPKVKEIGMLPVFTGGASASRIPTSDVPLLDSSASAPTSSTSPEDASIPPA
ncbi:uncharacterized protein LOC131008549 [Salvia miltiorrhiza]|uniref:uncharacterized protein LOC131008549 n=1 Tax=Salvia miltiorrhiza TaxID=226208 RepID=UPI0025ACC716|nr:uncharacterized protein LOC131008549 [Salvia miltiorrhiza]